MIPRDAPAAHVSKNLRLRRPLSEKERAEEREANRRFKHLLRNKGHKGAWAEIDGNLDRVAAQKQKAKDADSLARVMDGLPSDRKIFLPS